MSRTILVRFAVILIASAFAPALSASDWARSLFETRRHDFGTVARAAKAEYEFVIHNRYDSTIQLSQVRTSCGCTTPSIKRSAIPPGEDGAIVAKFNTRSYTGSRAATITVVFSRPYYAEVQLSITGYIRRDIVFNPGVLDFGTVAEGQEARRTIDVQYAGRNDWQITDVKSPDPHIHVRAEQTRRDSGRVGYQLIAELSNEAPAGFLNTQLSIETNDRTMNPVPLNVTGSVTPALTVSPALLYMGQVPTSGSVEKRIAVRAAEAFQITGVKCDDARIKIQPDTEKKSLHLLPIRFEAGVEEGEVSQSIQIQTDLQGGKSAELTLTATIAD